MRDVLHLLPVTLHHTATLRLPFYLLTNISKGANVSVFFHFDTCELVVVFRV